MAAVEYNVIEPQEGYQMKALSSSADIVIGGGSAGSGKTFCLLLDPIPDIDVKGFGGVIFRRTSPQIRNEGGLWDTSMLLFPHLKAVPRESNLEWVFPKGAKIKFSHIEYEKNVLDWQGSQIPFIGFDELTHFTKKMFFYLLTRNRSVCGVKPRVRATCNPDPESWVAELISWWIDQETGFPIPERDAVVRYLVVDGNDYIWGDTEQEVIEKAWHILEPIVSRSGIDPREFIKSVTYVFGDIYDNKELLKTNPAYLGNLISQDKETQSALLYGNWKIVISDNDVYDYSAFCGMFNNMYEVDKTGRYITADIALKGSDKFIAGAWEGMELIDLLIMNKSDGKEVIEGIKKLAVENKVQNQHITYDNDGVGGFVDGFIVGAIPFINNGTPLPNPDATTSAERKTPENYENLKTQCYYRSGANVLAGNYKISEKVANMMYDDKMTVRQRFMYERKAIKRANADADGKLKIIKKAEMKVKLNGQSPDLLDQFMMRERFNLKAAFTLYVK
ncbi:terminase large subunit domain-containing protein [Pedobacter cryoconitis]|uniref:Terminase family protein n=1 Tax=Pedobacter cryoconitis TaxID=188932 RepID=A0A327SIJ8_9SPHI|nr:terminase family protein [Pedobacter cryoconitis]RAJ28879.1 terminase family protein [Pedobacter cryoconitis]